ncbi:probable serine/threonine-protein kinase ndrD [Musca vetustissima]|uniref:probable serine/threonine-protein kinase ndrD n=1 Tax=Musca vetustissima TaxID=27455 RepID=UPI002AB77741|nr:probable serine/threonine-protein kinase ndrD [Musca vetustissima]
MSHKKLLKSLNASPTSTTSDFNNDDISHHHKSSQEMSASAAASAAAIALALDLKPKHQPPASMEQQHPQQQQQHQQKIKKLVRRNASDKLKLIQMVHDNPILWDSRLPNFKGAEEEKNRAWEMIGKEFNAPGRRVARAFKSLRESYRRELAHVKLMGNNFKPKWSLYEAMDFLRDVIRERKGGSHALEHSGPLGLNLTALAQHISNAAAANNNNNHNNNNNNKSNYKLNSMHSSFNDSALNLSKCSSNLNMSAGDDYYYNVKSELDLSNNNATHSNNNGSTQQHSGNQLQQHQLLHNDSRVSSTRNDSSSNGQNNTYDDLDNSSVRSGDEETAGGALSNQGSDEVEELEAIDADFPYPLILNSHHSPSTSGGVVGSNGGGMPPLKRRRKHLNSTGEEDNNDADDDDDDQDPDDYDGQMLQQHRHLRAQNMANGLTHNGLMGDIMAQPQTVREVLNSKFCGFISAKLNSMEDSEADNLMNKILMLLVQTQMNSSGAGAAVVATAGGTTGSSSPSGCSSLNVSTPPREAK